MKKLSITFLIIVVLLAGIGWIMNFVKFINLDFKAPIKAEIVRGVGLSSYGVIIGWINIEDK